MSEQFTINQSLTYEQAMALPDGAVVSAVWNYDSQRTFCTVGSNDALGVPKKFGGSTLEHEDYWNYDQWHSVRLESLPEPAKPDTEHPLWVIDCDRCGTTHKMDERHACVAREPAKPERQASEIEKRAARMYESSHAASVESWCDNVNSCDSLFTWHNELNRRMGEYTEAYDYAKSIGAI